MYDFFEENGSMRSDAIRANPVARKFWIEKLERSRTGEDTHLLRLISEMLVEHQEDRPTAYQIRGRLIDYSGPHSYICPYCASPDALSQIQSAKSLEEAKAHQQDTIDSDEVAFPRPETTLPVTAEALQLPERPPAEQVAFKVDKKPVESKAAAEQCSPPIRATDTKKVPRALEDSEEVVPSRRRVRFSGLPIKIRPKTSDIEDVVEVEDEFISPEPIKPPPFRKEDSLPLPAATLAPSYILAGTNHFSHDEIDDTNLFGAVECNLFVYGRLMFPSILHAIAAASTKGVYSSDLKRRLFPTSTDWAKADRSIKHAAEAMTPAKLKGYDRWWPRGLNRAAAIQKSWLSNKILDQNVAKGRDPVQLETPGKVKGFLVRGIRSEALRYLDLLLCHNRRSIRKMKPPSNDDDDDDYGEANVGKDQHNFFQRKSVDVDVELVTGKTKVVQAETYVWADGPYGLDGTWSEDQFLRSPLMQSLIKEDSSWMEQERALATTMGMSFALVGDYLCSPITAGNIQDLTVLLKSGFDPNAACRYYGFPLQAAVSVGREDMVRLLIEYGADVNAWGGQYGTPLIAAAYGSRKAIMKLLLHYDADVFARNGIHVDALYQAVAHADYAVTDMLLEHGAWLCHDWTEITDLAAELKDSEIQALLNRYDVRKLHAQYQLTNKSEDESGEDKAKQPSVRRRSLSSDRDSHHSLHPPADSSWETMSKSKVLLAVMRKAATASRMSGNWKGRRGVTVVVAALNAGAPLSLIAALRNSIYPVKALIRILQEQDGGQDTRQQRRGWSLAAEWNNPEPAGHKGSSRRSPEPFVFRFSPNSTSPASRGHNKDGRR